MTHLFPGQAMKLWNLNSLLFPSTSFYFQLRNQAVEDCPVCELQHTYASKSSLDLTHLNSTFEQSCLLMNTSIRVTVSTPLGPGCLTGKHGRHVFVAVVEMAHIICWHFMRFVNCGRFVELPLSMISTSENTAIYLWCFPSSIHPSII